MNWHRLSASEIFEITGSKPTGLTASQVDERLALTGYNQLDEGKQKTIAGIFLSQFMDAMILILLVAAVISGIVGDLKDTIVILVIVVLNAIIGFIQEYRSEKAMQALKQMTVTVAKVIREGRNQQIVAAELVQGDVVVLEAGDAVPADIRIIESINLTVDESTLTGESHGVEKIASAIEEDDLLIGDRKNLAYKGTFITRGRGAGVVVATGMQTEFGRIAKMLQEKEVPTPLQQRMALFGKNISVIILVLCVIFFVAGWLRGEAILKMIMTSISLAVAAIPEALPAAITISLALAARRLVKQKSLIRKLPAVESLGSVSYICTDKTGTLTKNKMSVEQIFANGRLLERNKMNREAADSIAQLLNAFALNNDSIYDGRQFKGDSTEVALAELASEYNIQITEHPRIAELGFDSDRKLMTTFHQYEESIISFTKGAPDILFQRCKNLDRDLLQHQLDAMASKGLRLLGFACRRWKELPNELSSDKAEHDLDFLGLAGIADPPREEVADAVEQCKAAGIVPVMITGDHPLTARWIAERIGILKNKNDLIVTSQELAAMDSASFEEQVENIKVYARVSPEQKLHIVKALQKKGHFVAMTGDGVNDAPSLKRANIGIAMGITGTDVSKEAAHIILLDDNFSTIVRAIREGRRIYDNILKFIKYLMTTNSGELWTLLFGPIVGLPIALLPIHILWINLISDGLPAIALSFEKAEKNIMKRPPRPRDESVFANGRGFHILWVGLFMAAISLCAQAFSIANNLHWQTIVFNTVCLTQMAHVMAIRSERESFFNMSLFSNKPLIASVTLSLILQFIVTYTPALQPLFNTQSLTLFEFVGVGILSSLILFAVEGEKAVRRFRRTSE